jgi:hypothetical protein
MIRDLAEIVIATDPDRSLRQWLVLRTPEAIRLS